MDDDPPPNAAPRNESMKRNPPPLSWIQKLVAAVQSDCVPSAVAGLLVGFVVAYLVRRRQGRIGFRGVAPASAESAQEAPQATAQEAPQATAQATDGFATEEKVGEGGFNDSSSSLLQSFVTGVASAFCPI